MPVAHIWFTKGVPSYMAILLDVSIKGLERVVYYEDYVVINPGNSGCQQMDILTERELQEVRSQTPDDSLKVGMGAEALREIIDSLDLENLSQDLRKLIRTSRSKQKVARAMWFPEYLPIRYEPVAESTALHGLR